MNRVFELLFGCLVAESAESLAVDSWIFLEEHVCHVLEKELKVEGGYEENH